MYYNYIPWWIVTARLGYSGFVARLDLKVHSTAAQLCVYSNSRAVYVARSQAPSMDVEKSLAQHLIGLPLYAAGLLANIRTSLE